jgi:hypothetical protein
VIAAHARPAWIHINIDFVTLDLNGFKVGGGGTGIGTNAVGISTTNHKNIVI